VSEVKTRCRVCKGLRPAKSAGVGSPNLSEGFRVFREKVRARGLEPAPLFEPASRRFGQEMRKPSRAAHTWKLRQPGGPPGSDSCRLQPNAQSNRKAVPVLRDGVATCSNNCTPGAILTTDFRMHRPFRNYIVTTVVRIGQRPNSRPWYARLGVVRRFSPKGGGPR